MPVISDAIAIIMMYGNVYSNKSFANVENAMLPDIDKGVIG